MNPVKPTGDPDKDAQTLIDSWGTEIEAKGLSNAQWEAQISADDEPRGVPCGCSPCVTRATDRLMRKDADVTRIDRTNWVPGLSDGLTLPCSDCGEVPRFDYHVTADFWRKWVPDTPARLSVVCLPCLDRRCEGVGLAAALVEVSWTGTGHTVVMVPDGRYEYDPFRAAA